MKTIRPVRRTSSSCGFSLVGFIGVLAVAAIIATLSAPSYIKQADQAAWLRETQELQSISNAIVQSILRTDTVPDLNSLAQSIAGELGQPLSSVTSNSRRLARAFLYNPNGWLATATLPYVQTNTGVAARPANATVMVLSSLSEALPANLGSFDILWNTAEGAKPASWAAWTGKGEDLLFQRIDLAPLFHKLLLVNADRKLAAPYMIADGSTNINTIAVSSQAQAYFLRGTQVKFYYNTGTNQIEQTRELLLKDNSYNFINGRWSKDLTTPPSLTGPFAFWVDQFLKPPAPPDPEFAATQQAVISMFYYYLWGYASWAGVPPGPQTFVIVDADYPPRAALVSTPNGYQASLNTFTDNLIK